MHVMPSWARDTDILGVDAPLPLDRPFAASEATRLGVSSALRHRLVVKGLLRPLVRGVFVASQVPDSLRLRVQAAALVVPPHAVAVDRLAAWIHGVDALPRSAIHRMPDLDIFSATGSRMRRPGIASGIRELAKRDVEVIGGLPVTTRLRTTCDLGRILWRFDALGAIDGFLRLGLDHDELLAELDRYKGYRGVRQLRDLAPLGDRGAESQPESALRLHWYDAELPRPRTQIWVHDDDGTPTFRIDVGHEEQLYGAEYFGEEWHGDDEREHDESRLEWLARKRSWEIDVFTKEQVYGSDLTASAVLRQGFARAEAAMRARTVTYVDLSR
jgi:hypothetical protein